MKKILCVLIAAALVIMQTAALADVWDTLNSITDTLEEAANEAGDALGDVWSEAGEAIGGAIDSVGEALTESWNWASGYLEGISGDLAENAMSLLNDLSDWLETTGAEALEALKPAFNEMIEKLGVAADEAQTLWDDVMIYAENHGIEKLTLVKVTLAILTEGVLRGDEIGKVHTFVFDRFASYGIVDQNTAEIALDTVENSLSGILNGDA